MQIFLLAFSLLISKSLAQTSCLSAGSQGPQLNGQCPQVTDIPTDDGDCCSQGSVVGTVLQADVASTTTGASTTFIIGSTGIPLSACVDRINPFTGNSDCPQRGSLCSDPTYYTLMTQECPKTCQRCSTGIGSANCVDLINPKRGISDCPSLTSLCTDSNYLTVMKTQCPRTCGFCGMGITSSSALLSTGCLDLVNPRTGSSDCQAKKALCTDPNYLSVMQKQCAATCGFCSG